VVAGRDAGDFLSSSLSSLSFGMNVETLRAELPASLRGEVLENTGEFRSSFLSSLLLGLNVLTLRAVVLANTEGELLSPLLLGRSDVTGAGRIVVAFKVSVLLTVVAGRDEGDLLSSSLSFLSFGMNVETL
jgi:hypothetical protein